MERLKQRLGVADQAILTLEEILKLKRPSTIERDAAIQRFEYSFEAQWKCAKQFLRDIEGIDIASPKGVIRSCREIGIFEEDETVRALEMADDRNLSSHTYNEQLAQEIFFRVREHAQLLRKWHDEIKDRIV